MALYSEPPALREFKYDKPTLLVCWWATSFCTLIILLRLAGRFIRTERLFTEDRVAALALIPLYARMACVHYILIYGTNNAQFDGVELTAEQLRQKSIGSGLVLASRIFYAATLWILKFAVLEFLHRLTRATWERSWQRSLYVIRVILGATFVAVLLSDFVECRPYKHYWQVVPDPGGQCRQGYVQLLTMAVCNVLTDLLLVIFPIPIIVTSGMTVKRKIQLVLLFSLSLSVVGVTLYRVPHIIEDHGRQQYRSLLASVEILFATAAANSLVLGSFMRDRGLKKQKFRRLSLAESLDPSLNLRRPTLQRHWGSDEDLVRDVGMTVDPELQDQPDNSSENGALQYTPAPLIRKLDQDLERWQFPKRQRSNAEHSDDSLIPHDSLSQSKNEASVPPRRVSFFDVGGLLDGPESSGGVRANSRDSSKEDSAQSRTPPASLPASTGGFRRGSTALLQDLGGLFGPTTTRQPRSKSRAGGTELQTIPQSRPESRYDTHEQPGTELRDPGGLLS
ncbi:related to integral membrane protein PTH11 [Fusarium torulosum]|uniref:Related to integral membrane protein PTH11 n=1 Tax=Fusarium torulosum TaxID=33205 RepID=A0AAE8MJT3_9HYPO|nr:related to integral membrane protein PTH11 [Fusarium torulosum]